MSLTCFGGVSSALPFQAIQILQQHGIIVDKYVLSPHSVNLFIAVESREAAVKGFAFADLASVGDAALESPSGLAPAFGDVCFRAAAHAIRS